MVQEAQEVVSITDKAAEKAVALLQERGVENGALRVFVVGGGCSGYQYGMAIAQGREDDDIVIEHAGVTVLVDAESAPLMRGAEIDYVDDLMKSGFTIFNPNAVKSCACGSSFQTAEGGGQARSCC
ncbi:MAG TPA: iron-sulfur cluster assembly accessory protein [Dehalococcoidia bacterium]|jgi:iron-sulfur cluster assembly protein|nr:iron-sulfur cluster assembly accessory protein [Dehalococcoidia bacterium]